MYWTCKTENSKRLRLRCDRGSTIAIVRPVKTGWMAEGYINSKPAWVHLSSAGREAVMEKAKEWARRQGWR